MRLEAIMVKITTEAKAIAPTPGSMVAIACRFTRATRIEIMKMSTIDQRPTDFDHPVEDGAVARGAERERRCTEMRR